MTPHAITIHDFLTTNALTGLGIIAVLFAGMGSLIYVMMKD